MIDDPLGIIGTLTPGGPTCEIIDREIMRVLIEQGFPVDELQDPKASHRWRGDE